MASTSFSCLQAFEYIVDCGSGGTRVETFAKAEEGCVKWVQHISLEPQEVPSSVCKLLARRNTKEQEKWIKALEEAVSKVNHAPVTLGCTAGVRSRMVSGEIVESEVNNFFKAVRRSLQKSCKRSVKCFILTGEQESLFEYLSVEYCMSKLPEAMGAKTDALGLLSAGGMSSQLYYAGNSQSLPTILTTAHKWILDLGHEEGLVKYSQYLKETCVVDLNHQGKLKGIFVGIELLAEVGRSIGVAKRLVKVGRVQSILKMEVENFKSRMSKVPPSEYKLLHWKDAAKGTGPLLTLHLLESLHPESLILLTNTFKIDNGYELKPTWSLGLYIQDQITI